MTDLANRQVREALSALASGEEPPAAGVAAALTGAAAAALVELSAEVTQAALALLTFLRFLNHYPSHIWIWAFLDRMQEFLAMYLVLNFFYLGQTGLAVLVRLGRPLPKGAP